MAYNARLGYDPDKDYSLAMQGMDKNSAAYKQLETERSNKINAVYGGVEPTLAGSNKTYSQTYGSSGGSVASAAGSTAPTTSAATGSYTPMGGTTDYDKLNMSAEDYAKIQSYKQAYNNAVTDAERQSAHDAAEALRGKYGYSSLGDGSGYVETPVTTNAMLEALRAQMQQTMPQYGSMQQFADAMGYSTGAQAIQDAVQASVDQATLGYKDQITQTNEDAARAARQAYIAKRLGEKNLEQEMSASGYAGGLADSQRIALDATYQNDLTELLRGRDEAIAALNTAITNAQLTGDLQAAQQLQTQLAQLQSAWQSYLSEQSARSNSTAQLLAQLTMQQEQNDYERTEQQKANAYDRAMVLLGSGIMPEAEELAAAGISTEQAALIQALARQKTGTTAGTAEPSDGTADTMPSTGTLTGTTFSNVKRSIAGALAAGDTIRADQLIDQFWNEMSEEQQQEIINMKAA